MAPDTIFRIYSMSKAITTAAAGWPWFARTRFVYGKRPAFEVFSINLRDGFLRIGVRTHRDKGEATGFAGKFVLHQHDFLDRAGLRKKLLQFVFGGIKWEISHV
jgi:hypothetical protein